MQVSPTNLGGADSNFDASRLPVRTLGQDDFLKLVVAQLTTQDPLNPQKDTEFIAQMAQFSQLEQSKSMQETIARLRADSQLLQANAMLGRVVELQDAQGTLSQGLVSEIQVEAGTPMLVVNGQAHDLSEVVAIQPGVLNPPAIPAASNP